MTTRELKNTIDSTSLTQAPKEQVASYPFQMHLQIDTDVLCLDAELPVFRVGHLFLIHLFKGGLRFKHVGVALIKS